MLEPRGYQERALAALDAYLENASEVGPQVAFFNATKRPYHVVPGLEESPYVCLRVPTGGGKTYMAAHVVGMATQKFLQRDAVLCLWLVPTNAILDQTLARLRDRDDPYRQVVDEAFGGEVFVLDISEALHVRPDALSGGATIIVSTLSALRVEDTDGRKVYAENGQLQAHFVALPALAAGDLETVNDVVVPSLANVMRLHRPLVIVDEAHNARTELSFKTLARVAPSCIIELTATPSTAHDPANGDIASNVLAHVSAAELKAEQMVKLPVKLVTRPTWTDAVGDAVALQRELERVAERERARTGEYIRPIVLMQAETRRQQMETMTPERLKAALVADFRVPEHEIAIATGSTREIEGVDLSSPGCAIRFIITQQALREGWDCPLAYVLCSVAEISSARSIEQILGRVLRLPKAKWKGEDALNCAYAIVVSSEFARVAGNLADALVENGFQRFEAKDFVVASEPDDLPLFGGALHDRVTAVTPEPPNLSVLDPVLRERVTFDGQTGEVTVVGPVTPAVRTALEAAFDTPEGRAVPDALFRKSQRMPHARSVPTPEPRLVMPRLCVRRGEELELFSESQFLDVNWKISGAEVELSAGAFVENPTMAGQVDVDEAGQVKVTSAPPAFIQATLPTIETGWTTATLAIWLDQQIPHPDLTQSDVTAFILGLLQDLESKGVPIEVLARHKFRLRRAIAGKIDEVRAAQRGRMFQAFLLNSADLMETSPEVGMILESDRYAPNGYYEGAYSFEKHLFPRVGDLKDEGEEYECAVYLDRHPRVRHWIRNLESRPVDSFWLPTARGRFYPDFVGVLTDGRVFALEYKGNHLWTNEDSRMKRAVGEVWAARSGGRCVFAMPRRRNWEGIDAAFAEA